MNWSVTLAACKALGRLQASLAVAGYQAAFADETTGMAEATATASVTGSSSECMTLMTSVTEGPYYLDGALVSKDITEGKRAAFP